MGMGALLAICGVTPLQNAVANGDTRTITLHHTHRGETGTFTFKKDGRYDPEVLAELNEFLRDWRNDKSTKMDPHLFDIVWEVYRETDGSAPIQVVSAYRSPETNAMLRARSSAVAKFSQHMLGKAMDFYIPGVNLAGLRAAGLRLQRGGVGFYPTSGSPFVHMDTGSVRHWPRMTHDQLARVFPDGKTVHVPSNGKPLSGYAEALAEVRARGASPGVQVASADAGNGVRKFFAGLFGKKDQEDDEGGAAEAPAETASLGKSAPARTMVAEASDADDKPASPAPAPKAAAPAPLPTVRPALAASATLATAQATLGPLAPLPQRRPADLPGAKMASLAPVRLPPVITRGSAEEATGALGYAAPGASSAIPVNTSLTAPTGNIRPRERARTASAAPFGRMYQPQSIVAERTLSLPELRAVAPFLAVPREIPAGSFSADATGGLDTAHFTGAAIAPVPTKVLGAPVKLTQLR